MTLREATFLTDENIHPRVLEYLRFRGYDVLDVKEAGLRGADDLTLIRQAFRERRVILTHDSDFGTLAIAAREPIFGVVYLRPGHISADFTNASLSVLLERDLDVAPPFVIVAERSRGEVRIRIRTL